MFSFLFGKKPKPKSVHVSSTLHELQGKEANLEARNKMLESQIKTLGEEAVQANRVGQKKKALMYMQKRKMYEQQLETNNAAILRLLVQRTALESNNINADTFDAMKRANEAIKEQQRRINPEAVAELNESLHELMGNQQEINEMMKEPIVPTLDLEEELAELEGAAAVPPEPQALNFPPVPAAPPVQKTVMGQTDMDRELAALDAL